MTGKLVVAMIAAAGIVYATTVSAQPEATLNRCQQTAGKEVNKYAAAVQKAAGKCLNKISAERIRDAAGNAAGAASSCAAAFRKLVNTEDTSKTLAAKTETKIERICDPAAIDTKAEHTAADVLGAGAAIMGDSIQADDLGSWCSQFGGDGFVNTIQEWIDCQLAAAECEARQQLAAEYPNALAWLADVRGDIVALGPDQKYVDAVTALDALDAALDGNGDNAFDLACGGAVPNCGNGAVESPEQCDGSDLNGASCTTLGFDSGPLVCTAGCAYDTSACVPGGLAVTGQTTSYGPGSDGDVQAGIARSFTDNGDGTISDNVTGLMWEKKEDNNNSAVECASEAGSCANPHDADNRYEWCTDDAPEDSICDDGGYPFDGSVVSIFLNQLNNRCNNDTTAACTIDANCSVPGGPCGFAGYQDWRLPNRIESESILNLGVINPAVFSPFNIGCSAACTLTTANTCSCTKSAIYWSSTTILDIPQYAFIVDFSSGFNGAQKSLAYYARAVRGGS